MSQIAFASSLFRSSNPTIDRIRFTPGVPGLQVGDGLLCVFTYKNVSGFPVTPPAGWTDVVNNGIDYVGKKIADAGDVSATMFDFVYAGGLSSENGILMRFTGIDPANFVDNNSDVISGDNPLVAPALTASELALFVIYGTGQSTFDRSAGSHTGPAGFTERHDHMSNEVSLAVYTKDVEAVSITSQNIVPSIVGNFSARGGTIALVGIPAGGGGIMAGPETTRETMERGTQIKNPFGGRMRRNACMCKGSCNCL